MTLPEAKALQYGQTLHWLGGKNADGSPMRYKVNGAPKTWKRQPERVQVPLKRGLYEFTYLTELELDQFEIAR